jgi:hypothetical protein
MTEVLGYDIDGQPLRAGDRVVLTVHEMKEQWVGAEMEVVGPFDCPYRHEPCVKFDDGGFAMCRTVRKLPPKSDHQPADEEFTEWLRGIGVGVVA